jgi:hypothetical protein
VREFVPQFVGVGAEGQVQQVLAAQSGMELQFLKDETQ